MAHDFCMFRLAELFPISKHSAILNRYMFRDWLVKRMLMQHISGSHKLMLAHNYHADTHCDSLKKDVFASLSSLAHAKTTTTLSTV